MDPQRVSAHPPRPESTAEWEDLLVRFEILPRALRVTTGEAAGAPGGTITILQEMAEREVVFSDWLQRAAYGGPAEATRVPPVDPDPGALTERVASLRARNFAMLQRRGLEVWDWSAPLANTRAVTAHQMVSAILALDAEALAALRGGVRLGVGRC